MSSKGRAYPTKDMRESFELFFSHTRLVFNLCVGQQKYYSSLRKTPSAKDRSIQLTQLRGEYPWLAATPAVILQQALKDYDQGMSNFFNGRANKPVFKAYNKGQNSFRVVGKNVIKIKKLSRTKYEVHIPKLGWCKVTLPRELPIRKVTSYTVSKTHSGRYHVAFTFNKPVNTAKTKSRNPEQITGLDLGCAVTVMTSTGKSYNFSRPDLDERVKEAQVALSKTLKGSNRRAKARKHLARLHERKRNARLYFAHQTSTQIARSSGVILLEGLPVANMTGTAKGTVENPGVNVAAKAGLNRSILDNGWGILTTLLSYKAPGRVFTVPYVYSSQKCSECGHIDAANRVIQELFKCVKCGFECNADFNAAVNLAATPQKLWVPLGTRPKKSTRGPKKKKRRKDKLAKLQQKETASQKEVKVRNSKRETKGTTTVASTTATVNTLISGKTSKLTVSNTARSSVTKSAKITNKTSNNKACKTRTPEGEQVTAHSPAAGRVVNVREQGTA